jgi:DNA-binding MarR family transcriptional regulator
MDLENIIIEGSRRLREWEQLQDELPNLDLALKFTDRPGVNIQNLNMSVEEWKVVSFINPKNTIHQIGKAAKMSEMDIRRVVYSLLQAGLVELVRPEGVERSLPGLEQTLSGKSKEEQKNLVNRLIGRIRSL